jgi:hypothetical protein
MLPAFLDFVTVRDLALGDARVDVTLRGSGHDVSVSVPRRHGDVRVVTTQ